MRQNAKSQWSPHAHQIPDLITDLIGISVTTPLLLDPCSSILGENSIVSYSRGEHIVLYGVFHIFPLNSLQKQSTEYFTI